MGTRALWDPTSQSGLIQTLSVAPAELQSSLMAFVPVCIGEDAEAGDMSTWFRGDGSSFKTLQGQACGLLTQCPLRLLPSSQALKQSLTVIPQVLLLVNHPCGLCPWATRVLFDSVYPNSSD